MTGRTRTGSQSRETLTVVSNVRRSEPERRLSGIGKAGASRVITRATRSAGGIRFKGKSTRSRFTHVRRCRGSRFNSSSAWKGVMDGAGLPGIFVD